MFKNESFIKSKLNEGKKKRKMYNYAITIYDIINLNL